MCGDELRMQRIDFGEKIGCPHCGEELILRERDAELVDDPSQRSNILQIPHSNEANQAAELPVGDRSLHRYLAAGADEIVAMFAAILVVKSLLESFDELTQGVLGVAIFFGYYWVCEGLAGTTPGKKMLDLCVVDRDGKKPSWKQITIRSLWRLIEVNPLIVGGLPAAIAIYSTSTHQRFGDKMAGTYVVFKS